MRLSALLSLCACLHHVFAGPIPGFRPPAVPLIVNDPYLSIWSSTDSLADSWSTMWYGTAKPIVGLIRIDGVPYRFMGSGSEDKGQLMEAMTQISVTVWPTRTVYVFNQSGIELNVTFTSALLPDSLETISRPVSYIRYSVVSSDGKPHKVELYHDSSAELAVNDPSERVVWNTTITRGNLTVLRVGTEKQNVLGMPGDHYGINWGYFYTATRTQRNLQHTTALAVPSRRGFATLGRLPASNTTMPIRVSEGWPVLAFAWNLGVVSNTPINTDVIIAYDDIASIDFFGTKMKGLWTNQFSSMISLIDESAKTLSETMNKCQNFDEVLYEHLVEDAGEEYATLAALIFRQTIGGTKAVWNDQKKKPWYFMKEISSDGDISTVDVIFPAAPLFLYFNATLLDLLLIPVLEYSANATPAVYHYSSEFAPHHLGTWPVANILTAQQEDMPIEESSGMLILVAAMVRYSGSLTTARTYWPVLTQWANYLVKSLPDPASQLCTDDFEGPAPHNANLALKGIIGLGAYAQLCNATGNVTESQKYWSIATKYVDQWIKLALSPNGTHYRQRYDIESWSLKYNLIWQEILGLKLFPDFMWETELTYYMEHLNEFGVPMDNRNDYTKFDSLSWIAAMADPPRRNTLFKALYNYANTTVSRVPLSDWFLTSSGKQQGFEARTVVGGLFANVIYRH